MSLAKLNKLKFLLLLEDWHTHSLYYPEDVAKRLTECGIDSSASRDKQYLILEDSVIPLSEPEWGEPGISPQSVLGTIYEITVGERPKSRMNGRGFWYRDVAGALAKEWGLKGHGPHL